MDIFQPEPVRKCENDIDALQLEFSHFHILDTRDSSQTTGNKQQSQVSEGNPKDARDHAKPLDGPMVEQGQKSGMCDNGPLAQMSHDSQYKLSDIEIAEIHVDVYETQCDPPGVSQSESVTGIPQADLQSDKEKLISINDMPNGDVSAYPQCVTQEDSYQDIQPILGPSEAKTQIVAPEASLDPLPKEIVIPDAVQVSSQDNFPTYDHESDQCKTTAAYLDMAVDDGSLEKPDGAEESFERGTVFDLKENEIPDKVFEQEDVINSPDEHDNIFEIMQSELHLEKQVENNIGDKKFIPNCFEHLCNLVNKNTCIDYDSVIQDGTDFIIVKPSSSDECSHHTEQPETCKPKRPRGRPPKVAKRWVVQSNKLEPNKPHDVAGQPRKCDKEQNEDPSELDQTEEVIQQDSNVEQDTADDNPHLGKEQTSQDPVLPKDGNESNQQSSRPDGKKIIPADTHAGKHGSVEPDQVENNIASPQAAISHAQHETAAENNLDPSATDSVPETMIPSGNNPVQAIVLQNAQDPSNPDVPSESQSGQEDPAEGILDIEFHVSEEPDKDLDSSAPDSFVSELDQDAEASDRLVSLITAHLEPCYIRCVYETVSLPPPSHYMPNEEKPRLTPVNGCVPVLELTDISRAGSQDLEGIKVDLSVNKGNKSESRIVIEEDEEKEGEEEQEKDEQQKEEEQQEEQEEEKEDEEDIPTFQESSDGEGLHDKDLGDISDFTLLHIVKMQRHTDESGEHFIDVYCKEIEPSKLRETPASWLRKLPASKLDKYNVSEEQKELFRRFFEQHEAIDEIPDANIKDLTSEQKWQICRFAFKYGKNMASRYFSTLLGFTVTPRVVYYYVDKWNVLEEMHGRDPVPQDFDKSQRMFTEDEKIEMAKYSLAQGPCKAAREFSLKFMTYLSESNLRAYERWYISRTSKDVRGKVQDRANKRIVWEDENEITLINSQNPGVVPIDGAVPELTLVDIGDLCQDLGQNK